jgi:hypothetical protein
MTIEDNTVSRLPVGFTEKDMALLLELQAVLQRKVNRRISLSETVRLGIRALAKLEGVKCK